MGRWLPLSRYGMGPNHPLYQSEYEYSENEVDRESENQLMFFYIKRAAVSRDGKRHKNQGSHTDPNASWLRQKTSAIFKAVYDLLKNPAYAIPLLLNITGSVWFFLLIGQAGTRGLAETVYNRQELLN